MPISPLIGGLRQYVIAVPENVEICPNNNG